MSAAAAAAANRNVDKKKHSEKRSKKNIYYGETQPEVADILYRQTDVREYYERPGIQFFVAGLIFGNFIVSAIYSEILPEPGSTAMSVFAGFEWFFNISFTIELIWNMYGSWFYLFWESGWNWFDFIIVIISLLSQAFPTLPGVTVLRLFRAFRVFRLFKRIKSLKRIIEGVLRSMPGVAQAFVVTFIIMGIWSVIGVEFFINAMPEHFGNFAKCMFTMWQIMTGDAWSSSIGVVLIYDKGLPLASIYLLSYIFISGIIMTNVVVAILLDKYLDAGIDDSLQITSLEGEWVTTDYENNVIEVNVFHERKEGIPDEEGNKTTTTVYKCHFRYEDGEKEEPLCTGYITSEEGYIYCKFNKSDTMNIQYFVDTNIENKNLLWIPIELEDGEDDEELIRVLFTWSGTDDFWESQNLGDKIHTIDKDMVWTKKNANELMAKVKAKNSWKKSQTDPYEGDQSEVPLASELIRADDESIIEEEIKFQIYKNNQFEEDMESAIGSIFDDSSSSIDEKRIKKRMEDQMKKMNLYYSYKTDKHKTTESPNDDISSSVDSRKGLLDHRRDKGIYNFEGDPPSKRRVNFDGEYKRNSPSNSSSYKEKNRRPNASPKTPFKTPPNFKNGGGTLPPDIVTKIKDENSRTSSAETKEENLDIESNSHLFNKEKREDESCEYEDLKYNDEESEKEGSEYLQEFFRQTKDEELDAWEEYVRKQCEKFNVKFPTCDTDEETTDSQTSPPTKKFETPATQTRKKRKIGNKIPDDLVKSENVKFL